MPVKDDYAKLFMGNNNVFAEVFNFSAFNRQPVIQASCLRPADTNLISSLVSEGVRGLWSKSRDILKELSVKHDGKNIYLMLGIENQSAVDYGMPARVMGYDSFGYDVQMREFKRKRRNSSWKQDPFTSAMKRGERLVPVVTVVVYFGKKEWDGPRSLHEMLDLKDDEVRQSIPDYPLKLLDISTLTTAEIDYFHTDFRNFAQVLKCSGDKHQLKELLDSDDTFTDLDYTTVGMINAYTGIQIPIIKNRRIDMRNGFQELIDDGKKEGRKEGRREGRREGREEGRREGRREEKDSAIKNIIQYQMGTNIPVKDIIVMLTNVFKISTAEATRRIKDISAALI